MRHARHLTSLLTALGLLVGLAPLSGRQAPSQTAAGAVILGRVIDGSTGQPIAGAGVRLTGRPAPPPPGSVGAASRPDQVITNRAGYYMFRDLPAGGFQISVSKAGYQNGGFGAGRPGADLRPLILGENETRTGVDIRLWKFGSISGTVVDEAGEPLVAVQVIGVERDIVAGAMRLQPRASTTTDDRGRYHLAPLPAGSYVIAVPAAHATVLTSTVDAFNSMTPDDPGAAGGQRPPGGGIQTDESRIISSAPSLQPLPPSPGERLEIYRTAFHPSVPSPGLARAVTLESGGDLDGIDVQLQLTTARQIRGRVVDSMGGSIDTLDLRLTPADLAERGLGNTWDVEMTRTGASGEFVFAAVPPGDYAIVGYDLQNQPRPNGATTGPVPQQLRWAELPVSVSAADVNDLVVALQPGLTVSGRFEFRGALPPPAPADLQRVLVTLSPIGHRPARLPRGVATDDDRRFVTAGYPPGRYLMRAPATRGWTVDAIMAGGRDVSLDPFVLDDDIEGVTVIYTDAPSHAQLTGTVTTAGDELLGTFVVAIPANYTRWIREDMSPRRAFVQQAYGGEYQMGGMPPGEYLVAAVALDDRPDLDDPDFIQRIVPLASLVTLAPREVRTHPLRAEVVR